MSPTGMCVHNNQENYCVTCAIEKSRAKFYGAGMGAGMGTTCPAGYSDPANSGTCSADISTLAISTLESAAGLTNTAPASVPGTVPVSQTLQSVFTSNPLLAWGATAIIAIIFLNFIRGK